jgi:hypothetical protein
MESLPNMVKVVRHDQSNHIPDLVLEGFSSEMAVPVHFPLMLPHK